MTISDTSQVTSKDKRKAARALNKGPDGQPFDPWDRLFIGFNENTVFEYGQFDMLAIRTMLGRDGKARGLEQVLTLPIRSATWKLSAGKGDTGELAFIQDTMDDTMINRLIDQCTTAISYRRAFFQFTWKLDEKNRIVYDSIDWRPPTGCDAGFDPKTGKYKGFRQRIVPVGGVYPGSTEPGGMPGYIVISPQRSFIYVHGQYREPVHGTSDLEVALWCYETRQKILFLWFAFLENQALPKVIVYGDDIDDAAEHVDQLATLKSSGLLGLPRGDPGTKAFEVLESSGLGAGQFYQAIQYLESMMTASVLASFTDLPQAAVQGAGSYALSADQSEFYLASRQAVADEIAQAIMEGVFGPLLQANFANPVIPKLEIGPMSSAYLQRAVSILQAIAAAPALNVPQDFVDQLVLHTAEFLGLDPTQLAEAVTAMAAEKKKAADLAAQQFQQTGMVPPAGGPSQAGPPKPPVPPGPVKAAAQPKTNAPASVPGPAKNPAGVPDGVKKLANVVDTVYDLVKAGS